MRRHDYAMEERLREQVRSGPRAAGAHRELSAWLWRAGRLAQAREALQAGLSRAEGAASLQHLLGLLFAGSEAYESAERHLARASAQEPMRFDYLRDLALVRAVAGKTAESVETLRQAAGLTDEVPADLECLLRLGEQALVQGGAKPERRPPKPRRRAAFVESLVARDPEMAEALVAGREASDPRKREVLRAARQALRRLIARNPAYPDLYFGMSLVAEQLGEIDRAIEAAEKAIALNPRYVEACLLAVRLYEKRGEPARAAQRCLTVTELEPQWLDAHLRLGHLLREQGRVRDAAEAYRRALGVKEDCEEARHGLERLEAALAQHPAEAAEGGAG
ncbi:MAG TPA: tetratricopeptide repeat protein [Phycisphaerae bacterium]|nr:tetratricopeptide repeat protein [Phycisphaerae bacterium]